jgi:hypothetical protein
VEGRRHDPGAHERSAWLAYETTTQISRRHSIVEDAELDAA